MTEEEARKKWCPMVRIVVGQDDILFTGQSSHNVELFSDKIEHIGRCAASNCMMWRYERVANPPGSTKQWSYSTEGYCGIAAC